MSARLEHLDAREIGELSSLFFDQAEELIAEVQQGLLLLERGGAVAETLRSVKRALHTIKGDATSLGYETTGHLCHRLEDVVAALAADPGRAAAGVEVLLAGLDGVQQLLGTERAGGAAALPAGVETRIAAFLGPAAAGAAAGAAIGERHAVEIDLDPGCREGQIGALLVRERLRQVGEVLAVEPDPGSEAAAPARRYRFLVAGAAETIAAAARLPGVVAQALVRREAPSGECPAGEPRAAQGAGAGGECREVLRIDAAKVDSVLDLVGELIVGRSLLEQAVRDCESTAPGTEAVLRLRAASAAFERTVGDLQKGALRMRMVPLSAAFRRFPRVVRDLARLLGKKARLEVEGQETELDKGIVDALGEPLNHLVRNMVDHGIEPPAERVAAGKDPEGRVLLRAYQEAARIVVEVADDGRGIDVAKLAERAAARGFDVGAGLSAEEAVQLVFLPGVTTADSVSETSGRGVGMDVVRSAVEAVKGTIEVVSRPGAGTTFRLSLPLTLAVLRTLLLEAGGRTYALPVAAIAEVARVRAGELATIDGQPCLRLRDQIVSVLPLGVLLGGGSGGKTEAQAGRYVLVLALRGRRFGVLVERLRGQQELVIKSVDERWVDAGVVAGASILGDGRVVLVLDAAAVVARGIERARVERGGA